MKWPDLWRRSRPVHSFSGPHPSSRREKPLLLELPWKLREGLPAGFLPRLDSTEGPLPRAHGGQDGRNAHRPRCYPESHTCPSLEETQAWKLKGSTKGGEHKHFTLHPTQDESSKTSALRPSSPSKPAVSFSLEKTSQGCLITFSAVTITRGRLAHWTLST